MIHIHTNNKQLEALRDYEKREEQNPNFYRIFGELRFLSSLSNSLGGKYDALITDTSKKLAASIAERHCTTPEAVREAENALSAAGRNRDELARQSLLYRRGLSVITGRGQAGKLPAEAKLPPTDSFLGLKGGILSALKQAEKNSRALVLRIFEAEGRETKSELRLAFPAESAILTDANEEKRLGDASVSGDGKTVSFTLPPWNARTLLVNMK